MSYHARLRLYKYNGDPIGSLPDTESIDLTAKYCAASTLKFVYPLQGVRASYLSAILSSNAMAEVAVEVSTNGTNWVEPPVGRFIITSSSLNQIDPTKDTVDVTLVSNASRLGDAVVLPNVSEDGTELSTDEQKRVFSDQTPGAIVEAVLDEAAARGFGADLSPLPGSIATYDSSGARWTNTSTLTVQGGTTLEKVLQELVDAGVLEWRINGRTLQLGNVSTENTWSAGFLSPLVDDTVIRLTHGAVTASESYDWSERCSSVIIEGEGGRVWTFANEYIRNDGAFTARFREKYVKVSKVTTEAQARIAALPYMRQGSVRDDTIKRSFLVDALLVPPFYDSRFQVGSWVAVERSNFRYDQGFFNENMRVAEMALSWSTTEAATIDFTFGSVEQTVLDRLTRAATQTENGVSVSSTAGAPAPSDTNAALAYPTQPCAPEDVVLTPFYGDPSMGPYLLVTWSEVTKGVNGKDWGGDGTFEYEVRLREKRESNDAPWTLELSSSTTQVAFRELVIGTVYEAQVRAVFNHAHSTRYLVSYSDWSELSNGVSIPVDTDAPPKPSTPSVQMAFQAVEVVWDGLAADGTSGRPSDYDHMVVSVVQEGMAPEETVVTASPNQLSAAVAGLPIGSYEVRVRTYDRTGNASEWSEAAIVGVESTVDKDDIQDKVDAALEIYEGKIGAAVDLANAMGVLEANTVKQGETPPSEGVVDLSFWKAPDGTWWELLAAGDDPGNAVD